MMTNYEFDGEQYRNASSHQKEWGSRIISELPLTGKETILDLGCGDGVLTEQLARRVPHGRVVGVDTSWNMIKTARELQRDNLTFRRMDINYLNVEDVFDVVFSNAALQWVKDHRRLLRIVYHSLKPGGFARFNFAGAGNSSNFIAAVKKVMAKKCFNRYFTDFSWPWYMPRLRGYRTLVKDLQYGLQQPQDTRPGSVYVGETLSLSYSYVIWPWFMSNIRENSAGSKKTFFRRVRLWQEKVDRYFASAEQVVCWLDQPALVPFLACVEDVDKQRFRRRVIEEVLRRTKCKNGGYCEKFRRINIWAWK